MPENNLSINHDVPVGVQDDDAKMPRVSLEGVNVYKSVISGVRQQLIGLVQEGQLTEVVAERLLSDFMFQAFNQFVKVRID